MSTTENAPPAEQRASPRELNRPSPVTMTKIQMATLNTTGANNDSPNKPSPYIYRQSTMTGSYSNESQNDLNSSGTVQFHYQVPNLSSMLYEVTNREKERVH